MNFCKLLLNTVYIGPILPIIRCFEKKKKEEGVLGSELEILKRVSTFKTNFNMCIITHHKKLRRCAIIKTHLLGMQKKSCVNTLFTNQFPSRKSQ